MSRWLPHVTVAAIIASDNRFLLVEETIDEHQFINQPAGHLEEGESLVKAVSREALEETGWEFWPEALVGICRWEHPKKKITYLRFAFCGTLGIQRFESPPDKTIDGLCWLTRDELLTRQSLLRSPQVITGIDHYLSGQRWPLNILTEL